MYYSRAEATAAELKDYLDGFDVDGASWSLGGSPVRIAMSFVVSNVALGVDQVDEMRQFLLHSDVFAETWASRPIPEPAGLLLLAAGVAPTSPSASERADSHAADARRKSVGSTPHSPPRAFPLQAISRLVHES